MQDALYRIRLKGTNRAKNRNIPSDSGTTSTAICPFFQKKTPRPTHPDGCQQLLFNMTGNRQSATHFATIETCYSTQKIQAGSSFILGCRNLTQPMNPTGWSSTWTRPEPFPPRWSRLQGHCKRLMKVQLRSYAKTSGKTGIHVYMPFGEGYTYEQARMFAEALTTDHSPIITRLQEKKTA